MELFEKFGMDVKLMKFELSNTFQPPTTSFGCTNFDDRIYEQAQPEMPENVVRNI